MARRSFSAWPPAVLLVFLLFGGNIASAGTADIGYAEKLFMEGKYERAVAELDKFIEIRSSGREEAYYLKGLSMLKMSRFEDARYNFGKVISGSHWSKRAFDAAVGIGDSYFLEGNTSRALQQYEDILDKYARDRNLPLVYHRIGNCYGKLGDDGKAKEYFDRFKKASPMSFESRFIANQPPTAVSAAKPAPPNGRTGYFSVQVGYFKSSTNAEKLSDKLKKQGYDSYVESLSDSGDMYYKVKAGKCRTKEDAKSLASRLRGLGYNTKISADDLSR